MLHGWRAVAMPLGISFTSFAAIAYLIDATRGDCEVETSFIGWRCSSTFCHRHPGAHLPRRCAAAAVERRAPL
ncbi:hypothetical protein [Gemmiger formicilis]|uniref:hypothetical protein n=1 Tax=Gemmiger formicilis TaxID=745368 RepID=UPI00399679A6